MYRTAQFTGSELPSKCLCLTYDDGPGKLTCEIAEFLHEQDIQATFFVVGKYAIHHQDVLKKISALGHLIGNHTYEHPDMPYYLSVDGDVRNQILRTDILIKNHIGSDIIYFRSPYGKWSPEVANELNANILTAINHVGPIFWDVGGVDCYYWKIGCSVEDTVKKYLKDIQEIDRGVVVMHDDIADMDYLKDQNKTLELTKQLIPLLKQQGYTFVRLDQIESLKREAISSMKFTLQDGNGKCISLSSDTSNTIYVNGRKNTIQSELILQDLGYGKIALKASNGLFFSTQSKKGFIIEAGSSEIGKWETFDLIPLSSDQVMLRAYDGSYLVKESRQGGKLLARAQFMREADRFAFSPVSSKSKKTNTTHYKYKMLKRKVLYVKSKVLEKLKHYSYFGSHPKS